jgi:hypothetical protein
MINQVKRLRLCVSDNENMRAAFSLLRVMVANEEELVRVTTSIIIYDHWKVIMYVVCWPRISLCPLSVLPHSFQLLRLKLSIPSNHLLSMQVRMLGPGNMFKTARDVTYPVR